MAKTRPAVPDTSTEEKIMVAARKVFMQKGYAATRTRDIAEEAGLNLALLNYYFRSKEKLFEIIMLEKLQKFFSILMPVLYDITSSLESKVENISANYIDMILTNPDLPFFILSESRNNPQIIVKVVRNKDFLKNSIFIKQLREKRPDLNPFHFLTSLLGMCIFPFIMKPMWQEITETDDAAFKKMMLERKQLIPGWIKAMLKSK